MWFAADSSMGNNVWHEMEVHVEVSNHDEVQSKLICWNCDGPHHLKDCKKPIDWKKVEMARSEFKPRGNKPCQSNERRGDK